MADSALEERVALILGHPRTGSTWLMRMLGDLSGGPTINEPLLGHHLAPFFPNLLVGVDDAPEARVNDQFASVQDYCLSPHLESTWRPLLQAFVLGMLAKLAEQHDDAGGSVIVKEPNSSHAADLLCSLLPGSRLIFLVRDGRDVIDSIRDALLGSQWWRNAEGRPGPERPEPAQRQRLLEHHARLFVFRIDIVRQAYESFDSSRRLLVRYEDLRRDTAVELRRLSDLLELETSDQRLSRLAEHHRFENVPSEQRGPGMHIRSATPGGWRENLTDDEVAAITPILEPQLRSFGYL